MKRLGLKSNRKGRNRVASERKGRKKVTKIGEKGHPSKGVTKKKIFSIRALIYPLFLTICIGVLHLR